MVRKGDIVGFKVEYTNGGAPVVGEVVDNYYNHAEIVIVKDEGKNLYKVREEDVIVFKSGTSSEEPEEKPVEDNESDTITISRKEFREISTNTIDPKNFVKNESDTLGPLMISLSGLVVVSKLENALFDGKKE